MPGKSVLGNLRRRQQIIFIGILAIASMLFGCNDSSSKKEPQPTATHPSHTVTDLSVATQYYWKVVATDATGLKSESEVRSFTTQ